MLAGEGFQIPSGLLGALTLGAMTLWRFEDRAGGWG